VLHRSWLIAICALAACRQSPDRPSVELWDSAGVQIVTSHRAQLGENAWTVTSTPLLELGGPGTELYRVRGALKLTAGRLLVATATDLFLYDPEGALIRKAGGSGKGPGEFTDISTMAIDSSETLQVWDLTRSRSIYSADLTHLRTEAVDRDFLRSVAPYVAVPTPLSEDLVLISAAQMESREPAVGDIFRPQWLHAVLDLDVQTADTLLLHPGGFSEVYLGGRASSVEYFSPHYTVAVSPAKRVFIADGAAFSIRECEAPWQLVRIIRRTTPNRRVSRAEADTARSRRKMLVESSRGPVAASAQLSALPEPSTFPALDELTVDDLGYTWVREPIGPLDRVTTWSVFSPDGIWLTSVSVPGAVKALDIGHDYIVGLSRDELDQEFVKVYELQRGAGDSRVEPDA
jgi:hypothetical protein